MEKYDIYKDIEKRTGGDVYIGVVGPVRTGKSTFVSKFMQLSVIPNIVGKNKKAIATDEMPQSGAGKTIMTTEPKFVPGEAVSIKVSGGGKAKVRLIDCVGYTVKGSLGLEEDGKARLVKTPWQEEPMPFEKAAEYGTERVVKDHSTIAVVVTTDGSFTDIARESYAEAEERVIDELKAIGKPFIVLLNVTEPDSERSKALGRKIEKKYGAKVVVKNAESLSAEDIDELLAGVLLEFPVRTACFVTPDWMRTLDEDNRLIAPLLATVKNNLSAIVKMGDYKKIESKLEELDFVVAVSTELDLGEGSMRISITPDESAFYEELSSAAGEDLSDELTLMKYVLSAKRAKKEYNKIKGALEEAEQTGYGIVPPSEDEITLSEPEMVKNGNSYGVKIKATAPSLHVVRVEIGAEVNSVVGKESQCATYVDALRKRYEEDPGGIMKIDLFGRPLYSFVSEEIYGKAGGMKAAFREKLKKTVSKLVNEKKSALFCVTI